MLSLGLTVFALWATLAYCHFSIDYPLERGDTLNTNPMMQLTYPCQPLPCLITLDSTANQISGAGVGQDVSASNRTEWPINGGSLKITATHRASDVYIALAFGDDIPKAWYFNHTLTSAPLNQTGTGSFCLPQVPVPSEYNVTDGTTASLQVIMYAFDGAAVYGVYDSRLRSFIMDFVLTTS